MNNDDMDFISGTETCRAVSNLCFISALIFLASIEAGIIGSFLNWVPSIATPIVFALLGIGLRLVAIDRFLRMARQKDHEAKSSSYSE